MERSQGPSLVFVWTQSSRDWIRQSFFPRRSFANALLDLVDIVVLKPGDRRRPRPDQRGRSLRRGVGRSRAPPRAQASARIGLEEGVPELLPPEHVDEKVGRRVDAHEQVAQGDERVDDAVGGAVVGAADEALVDVGDELEALAAEEEEGDAD